MKPVLTVWSKRTTLSVVRMWPTSHSQVFLAVILPTSRARSTALAMTALGGTVAWSASDRWTALLMLG
jgi:hypothetical protein